MCCVRPHSFDKSEALSILDNEVFGHAGGRPRIWSHFSLYVKPYARDLLIHKILVDSKFGGQRHAMCERAFVGMSQATSSPAL